jgi:hypothetical protein
VRRRVLRRLLTKDARLQKRARDLKERVLRALAGEREPTATLPSDQSHVTLALRVFAWLKNASTPP